MSYAIGIFMAAGAICAAGLQAQSTSTGPGPAASSGPAKPASSQWAVPEIALPKDARHPLIACTAEELARLKQAVASTGPANDAVMAVIDKAKAASTQPLTIPPRGAQHNQWYQCEACQMGLKTIDDTHHQCPKCRKVYSGPPYDDVILTHQHNRNFHNALAAAWAYAITGKTDYADFTARVLLEYADRYAKYPYHTNRIPDKPGNTSGGHIYEQSLQESFILSTQIAPAYDLIHDRLSNEDRQKIADGLIIPMLKNLGRNNSGKSNWQTWHNAAMVCGGIVLRDESWLTRGLIHPRNGFGFQMGACVSDEGLWHENSWGYHLYTLHALVTTAEACRRIGIDLWSCPQLRKMCTLPARFTMPDGLLPRIGDDTGSTARRPPIVEPAFAAIGDDAMRPLLDDSSSFQSVMLGRRLPTQASTAPAGSEVFTGSGQAILRTGGPDGLVSVLNFGPFGGFHGHFDKLSFILYGRGEELGADRGRAASQAYRLAIHNDWYRATASHNTVVVDGASQDGADGKLLAFAANQACAAVLAECTKAYPNVTHRRLLVQRPGYLLVVDDLAADKEREFTWLYHNHGGEAACTDAATPGQLPNGLTGREYIQNVKTGKSDSAIVVAFGGKTTDVILRMDAQKGTGVAVGDGAGSSVMHRVPMAMCTRRGTTARFAAVLEPVAKGAKPAVSDVKIEQAADGTTVTVAIDGVSERIVISGDNVEVFSGTKRLLLAKPTPDAQ